MVVAVDFIKSVVVDPVVVLKEQEVMHQHPLMVVMEVLSLLEEQLVVAVTDQEQLAVK